MVHFWAKPKNEPFTPIVIKVGGRGFEPHFRSPELRVLPLDEPPENKKTGMLLSIPVHLSEEKFRMENLLLPLRKPKSPKSGALGALVLLLLEEISFH